MSESPVQGQERSPEELAAVIDRKIETVLGMGIGAKNKRFSAELLYDTLFTPGAFRGDEAKKMFASAHPQDLTVLAEPLPEMMQRPDRESFVQAAHDALISQEVFEGTPFEGAAEAVDELLEEGQVVVWTQGDEIEQLRKVHFSGIGRQKRQQAPDEPLPLLPIASSEKLSPFVLDTLATLGEGKQVFIAEDRLENLVTLNEALAARGIHVTPIWVQQGRHGHKIPSAMQDAPSELVAAGFNAVADIRDVPNKIRGLRQEDSSPLFVIDYDGVVSDDDLRRLLQTNALRQYLSTIGVPEEAVGARSHNQVIADYKAKKATTQPR